MNNICHLRSIIHLQIKQKLEYALIWNDSVELDPWCFLTTCCLHFFAICHVPICFHPSVTEQDLFISSLKLKDHLTCRRQPWKVKRRLGMQHRHLGTTFHIFISAARLIWFNGSLCVLTLAKLVKYFRHNEWTSMRGHFGLRDSFLVFSQTNSLEQDIMFPWDAADMIRNHFNLKRDWKSLRPSTTNRFWH